MRPIVEGFRNLPNFEGRMPRRLFWPYAATVFGLGYCLYMIALFPAIDGMLGSVRTYAATHPGAVRETIGVARYSVQVNDPSVLSPMMTAILWAGAAFVCMLFLFLAAAVVRRLHDTGRTGWWGLLPIPFICISFAIMPYVMSADFDGDPEALSLFFVGFISNILYLVAIITLIVFLAQRSEAGANRFGTLPLD